MHKKNHHKHHHYKPGDEFEMKDISRRRFTIIREIKKYPHVYEVKYRNENWNFSCLRVLPEHDRHMYPGEDLYIKVS